MNILVNGESQSVADDASVQSLVDQLELGGRRLAVEINREIVPRSEYSARRLREGDRVEIVHAIGGGSERKHRSSEVVEKPTAGRIGVHTSMFCILQYSSASLLNEFGN